jgi:hypothetical protein
MVGKSLAVSDASRRLADERETMRGNGAGQLAAGSSRPTFILPRPGTSACMHAASYWRLLQQLNISLWVAGLLTSTLPTSDLGSFCHCAIKLLSARLQRTFLALFYALSRGRRSQAATGAVEWLTQCRVNNRPTDF